LITVHMTDGCGTCCGDGEAKTITLLKDGHTWGYDACGNLEVKLNGKSVALFNSGSWDALISEDSDDPVLTESEACEMINKAFADDAPDTPKRPDPGYGWRLLEQDEVQQGGDEYLSEHGVWLLASPGYRVSCFQHNNIVRRQVETPTAEPITFTVTVGGLSECDRGISRCCG
jgi:hypothetical protein